MKKTISALIVGSTIAVSIACQRANDIENPVRKKKVGTTATGNPANTAKVENDKAINLYTNGTVKIVEEQDPLGKQMTYLSLHQSTDARVLVSATLTKKDKECSGDLNCDLSSQQFYGPSSNLQMTANQLWESADKVTVDGNEKEEKYIASVHLGALEPAIYELTNIKVQIQKRDSKYDLVTMTVDLEKNSKGETDFVVKNNLSQGPSDIAKLMILVPESILKAKDNVLSLQMRTLEFSRGKDQSGKSIVESAISQKSEIAKNLKPSKQLSEAHLEIQHKDTMNQSGIRAGTTITDLLDEAINITNGQLKGTAKK